MVETGIQLLASVFIRLVFVLMQFVSVALNERTIVLIPHQEFCRPNDTRRRDCSILCGLSRMRKKHWRNAW